MVLEFMPCSYGVYFQECIFNKVHDRTGLRVFWNGPLRIYNCHACCRRWYFKFNGAECSTPAAIDGVVYMVHGNGAKKDLHRVRQIEGVCEKVPKGVVRVELWVGDCAGYGSADAYTGWNSARSTSKVFRKLPYIASYLPTIYHTVIDHSPCN